ncbi:hypothetical protein LTR91_011551 [Friedmanniomyces endolithicus]|uniref:Major facilitator superfamily (MFS) profile domain-containing protein n=1 Tax=Friedmanniomyces endolithicus TaxID=329885 RepID=A0AAN6QRV6_9PEZI|nr:hypothetical protein LTR94_011623 [Friedmanniomyces endolithicus]KAK0791924.1 hypothetical protein LTR38_010049 [Friedmanniomyces endolithicus]KAK0806311.1 hypothetical protein LTR59_003724 [Friedmanniomyces endolithicus]KAK0842111.1 hypothetical protein LTR03_009518 [Friedmanniomyces endolithicus]KAK0865385.1 hypothetical protein LTS02_005366 [Friedmanniomyces endolithicus]
MLTWLTGSPTHPPALLPLRSSPTFIILTVSTAVFTDIFVYGIVVPVLPFALTSRSAIPPAQIQTWISIFLAVYGAALLIASPICGWLADRSSSRRLPLLCGLLALGGCTVMLCIGSSIAVLAAGRVLQGFSAAVVWVVGLALMVDTAGYYAVFAMAFGLIVVDVVLRVFMVERKVAARWLPEREGRTPHEAVATTTTEKGVELKDVELADAGLSTADDLKRQSTGPQPQAQDGQHTNTDLPHAAEQPSNEPSSKRATSLPPIITLLSSRRLLSALWACLMQATLLTAFDSILPLFVRNTFHWTSVGAGLIFLPLVVASFFGPLVGWASDRMGPRWLATSGFALSCPFLILLRLVERESLGQKALLCALLGFVGVGLTLVLTPMMAEITYAVDARARRLPPGAFGKNGAYAQAYSLFNMAWAGGCLVGPLLAGLVNQRAGWGPTTLILGVVSIATAVPTAVWTGGSIWKKRRSDREAAEGADVGPSSRI